MAKALGQLAEIAAQRGRTRRKKGRKPAGLRVSTTDPQARVMKMADGGFRPACNCQIVTAA